MHCEFCGAVHPDPRPVQPAAEVRCDCGYITLVEFGEQPLPLGELIQQIAPARRELLVDTNDPDECRRRFLETFNLVIDACHDVVCQNLEAACASVWRYLEHFEERSMAFRRGEADGGFFTSAARATQSLLGSIYVLDAVPALPSPVSADVQAFVPAHSKLSTNLQALSAMADNLRHGLTVARMQNGTLFMRKTPLHTRMMEWMANRNDVHRRARRKTVDEIFSRHSAEAQFEWLGFSPDVGRRLFENRHQRLRALATEQVQTAYYIPQHNCDDEVDQLFQALQLTPERIARFSEPFHWDLGNPEDAGDMHEFLFRLARHNWLNYYPVIPLTSDRDGPAYFVSAEALTYALGNLESYKGRLLERVYTAAQSDRGVSKSTVHRIAKLRAQANRTFEDAAARIAADAGFRVATSVTDCGGSVLEAGEIDLLFGWQQGTTMIIGVAEVKDFDITLHRVHTVNSLKKKVGDAEAQLERKAREVRRKWLPLLDALTELPSGPVREVRIVSMVITSQLLPAFVLDRFPVVAMDILPEFCEMLRDGPDQFPQRFAAEGLVRFDVVS